MESEDEEDKVPDKLRDQWQREEFHEGLEGRKMAPCPHCGKLVDAAALSCIFCGGRVFQDSGLLGRLCESAPGGVVTVVTALILLAGILLWFVMV